MPSYIHLARTVSPLNPPLCAAALPDLTLTPLPNLSTTALIILDFGIFSLPSSTNPVNMSDVIADEAVCRKIVQTDNVSATQAST